MVMTQWMTGCLRWSLHQNGPGHKGHVAQHFRQLSGAMQQQNSLTRESKIRLVLTVEFILCDTSSWCCSKSFLTLEVVPSTWGVLFSTVEVPFGVLLLVTSTIITITSHPLKHWSSLLFVRLTVAGSSSNPSVHFSGSELLNQQDFWRKQGTCDIPQFLNFLELPLHRFYDDIFQIHKEYNFVLTSEIIN